MRRTLAAGRGPGIGGEALVGPIEAAIGPAVVVGGRGRLRVLVLVLVLVLGLPLGLLPLPLGRALAAGALLAVGVIDVDDPVVVLGVLKIVLGGDAIPA